MGTRTPDLSRRATDRLGSLELVRPSAFSELQRRVSANAFWRIGAEQSSPRGLTVVWLILLEFRDMKPLRRISSTSIALRQTNFRRCLASARHYHRKSSRAVPTRRRRNWTPRRSFRTRHTQKLRIRSSRNKPSNRSAMRQVADPDIFKFHIAVSARMQL